MSERQSRFRFSRTTAIRWPAALLLGVLLAGPAWAAVSDFTLTDHLGKSHQLSWYSDQRLVVIAAFAAGDATSVEAARQLHSAQGAADAPDDVVFMLINARPADSRGSVETALTAAGLNLPVLMDETQLVTGNLGLSRHGEVVVLDPDTREVRHRGSAAGLPEALEALLAAQPVTASAAEGAAIEFSGQAAVAAQGVSYTDDIAPMLKANCVVCHTPGGIAPWAMTGHAMVRGWAPMMREVVLTRRMPPGQFDTHASLPMADAAGLSTLQQQQLLHWIDAGAPWDGKGADPLAEVQAADSRFTLGEPDLLFEVPAQAIPATGIIDYRYVPVNLNLDRDLWLRAVEFVPGDRQVLHHVIAYLASPADRTSRGRGDGSPQGESLAGFAPGRQPDQFGPEGGRFVPKGSNLLLQMHYTTSGRETVDKTQVGLYLHEAPPKYVMREAVAGQRRLPGASAGKGVPLTGRSRNRARRLALQHDAAHALPRALHELRGAVPGWPHANGTVGTALRLQLAVQLQAEGAAVSAGRHPAGCAGCNGQLGAEPGEPESRCAGSLRSANPA